MPSHDHIIQHHIEWNAAPPCSLLALPDELLVRIYLLLDLRSITTVRQTCRQLHAISKERSIWVTAIKLLGPIFSQQRRFALDKPISQHATADLERLVLRMARFHTNWTSEHPKILECKAFKGRPYRGLRVVPGGRWLLEHTADRSGRISCYDLDDLTKEPFTLIEPVEDDQRVPIVHSDLTLDDASEGLAFDIIIHGSHDVQTESAPLSLWRVVFDSSLGRLRAAHHKTFSVYETQRERRTLSVRDGLLSRVTSSGPAHLMVEIYRWAECDERSHLKCIFAVENHFNTLPIVIRLLPGHRILLLTDNEISVLKIPNLRRLDRQVTEADLDHPTLLWSHQFRGAGPGCSFSSSFVWWWYRTSSEVSQFSFFNTHATFLVTLEGDTGTVKQIPLLQVPHRKAACITVSRGVWASSGTVTAATYLSYEDAAIVEAFLGSKPMAKSGGWATWERPLQLSLAEKGNIFAWRLDQHYGRIVVPLNGKVRAGHMLSQEFLEVVVLL